jgi:hypothetical protein
LTTCESLISAEQWFTWGSIFFPQITDPKLYTERDQIIVKLSWNWPKEIFSSENGTCKLWKSKTNLKRGVGKSQSISCADVWS